MDRMTEELRVRAALDTTDTRGGTLDFARALSALREPGSTPLEPRRIVSTDAGPIAEVAPDGTPVMGSSFRLTCKGTDRSPARQIVSLDTPQGACSFAAIDFYLEARRPGTLMFERDGEVVVELVEDDVVGRSARMSVTGARLDAWPTSGIVEAIEDLDGRASRAGAARVDVNVSRVTSHADGLGTALTDRGFTHAEVAPTTFRRDDAVGM